MKAKLENFTRIYVCHKIYEKNLYSLHKRIFFVLNNYAEKSMDIIRFHENEYRNIQRVVYIFTFDKDAHNVAITC